MGQAATGEAANRLQGIGQRVPILRRTGDPAIDLRFSGAGGDRTGVPQVAGADSSPAAKARPGGWLRLGSVDVASRSEPDADLRSSVTRARVLRGSHSRQTGTGAS